jgi:lipopolysaccharide/colanic/teichoic acid biosynthesis glycosyltransferase
MSFVGFRPPTPDEVVKYAKWHHERFNGRPGMTSEWAVSGAHKIKFDDWIRKDIEYNNKESFLADIDIISRTALNMFKRF